jgi:hypothetical protein
MNTDFVNIVNHGTFYYPAWKHYSNPNLVCCDRCGKKNIYCCIGFEKMDLCLKCADIIVNNIKNDLGILPPLNPPIPPLIPIYPINPINPKPLLPIPPLNPIHPQFPYLPPFSNNFKNNNK